MGPSLRAACRVAGTRATAQTHGLLIHGDLVGVDGGLGQDARSRRSSCSAGPPACARSSFSRYSRTVSGERSSTLPVSVSMVVQPGRRCPRPASAPPSRASGYRTASASSSTCADVRANGLQVLLRLRDGQHVRNAGEVRARRTAFDSVIPAVDLIELCAARSNSSGPSPR